METFLRLAKSSQLYPLLTSKSFYHWELLDDISYIFREAFLQIISSWLTSKILPSGAPELHALLNYFGINSVLITLTLTPFIVLGINDESVVGALWDCTCTPEITLTLLNGFQINFPQITLTLTLLLVFELQM